MPPRSEPQVLIDFMDHENSMDYRARDWTEWTNKDLNQNGQCSQGTDFSLGYCGSLIPRCVRNYLGNRTTWGADLRL